MTSPTHSPQLQLYSLSSVNYILQFVVQTCREVRKIIGRYVDVQRVELMEAALLLCV